MPHYKTAKRKSEQTIPYTNELSTWLLLRIHRPTLDREEDIFEKLVELGPPQVHIKQNKIGPRQFWQFVEIRFPKWFSSK